MWFSSRWGERVVPATGATSVTTRTVTRALRQLGRSSSGASSDCAASGTSHPEHQRGPTPVTGALALAPDPTVAKSSPRNPLSQTHHRVWNGVRTRTTPETRSETGAATPASPGPSAPVELTSQPDTTGTDRTLPGAEQRRAPSSRRSMPGPGYQRTVGTRAVRRAFRGSRAPGRAVGTDLPRGELPDLFAPRSFLVRLHTARTPVSCGRSRHLRIRGESVCTAKPCETARTPPLDGSPRSSLEPAGRGGSKGDSRRAK